MESSDKNPPPSEPGRPSLLSPEVRPAPDKDAAMRMLAGLERETPNPAAATALVARKSSRNRIGLAALALLLVGGGGAYFALQPFNDDSNVSMTALAEQAEDNARARSAQSAHQAPATAPTPAASGAGTGPMAAPSGSGGLAVASGESSAASTPDRARIELASGASATLPLPAAPAVVAPSGSPLDKLALTDSEIATKHAHAHEAAHPVAKDKDKHRHKDAHKDAKAHAHTPAAATATAKAKTAPAHAAQAMDAKPAGDKRDDDADTAMVAAIMARIDQRAPRPAKSAQGSTVSQSTIAEVVKRCSASGDPVEARQCRNRICENYWGKADACPASHGPQTPQVQDTSNERHG